MNLLIVTGLSGSGKSIALQTLEDLDYYCIDNLPVGMLLSLSVQMRGKWGEHQKKYAVGIDVRSTSTDLDNIPSYLEKLKKEQVNTQIIFLRAKEHTLLERFHETRRKHPLSGPEISLTEALALEKKLLEPLAADADILIDTTNTNIHQLRDIIRERLQLNNENEMSIQFQSFGYKHGLPTDVDIILDVRCLPNPHWDPNLRALTGKDVQVINYLERHDEVQLMKKQIIDYLATWFPHFEKSNRSYMNIAIGCTGGQHRSVYLVNAIAGYFKTQRDNIIIRHRELDTEN